MHQHKTPKSLLFFPNLLFLKTKKKHIIKINCRALAHAVTTHTAKIMMAMDNSNGVSLFPTKNPRPGPDPGGGIASLSCRTGSTPVVLSNSGGSSGAAGVSSNHHSLGQVNLTDRSYHNKPAGRIHIGCS